MFFPYAIYQIDEYRIKTSKNIFIKTVTVQYCDKISQKQLGYYFRITVKLIFTKFWFVQTKSNGNTIGFKYVEEIRIYTKNLKS